MRRVAVVALIVVAAIATLLLYKHFDPTHSILAPKCPVHLLTGYECPSCGVQRAAHAVLNGDFRTAFWLNPFLVLAVPYLLLLLLVAMVNKNKLVRLREILHHNLTIYSYIALYFIWWVVRNSAWWRGVCGPFLENL